MLDSPPTEAAQGIQESLSMLGAQYDEDCKEVSQLELGKQTTASCCTDGEGTGPPNKSVRDLGSSRTGIGNTDDPEFILRAIKGTPK